MRRPLTTQRRGVDTGVPATWSTGYRGFTELSLPLKVHQLTKSSPRAKSVTSRPNQSASQPLWHNRWKDASWTIQTCWIVCFTWNLHCSLLDYMCKITWKRHFVTISIAKILKRSVVLFKDLFDAFDLLECLEADMDLECVKVWDDYSLLRPSFNEK